MSSQRLEESTERGDRQSKAAAAANEELHTLRLCDKLRREAKARDDAADAATVSERVCGMRLLGALNTRHARALPQDVIDAVRCFAVALRADFKRNQHLGGGGYGGDGGGGGGVNGVVSAEQTLVRFLLSLNEIWQRRVQSAVAKLREKHAAEMRALRRLSRNNKPYSDVLQKSTLQRLRRDLMAVRKRCKCHASRNSGNGGSGGGGGGGGVGRADSGRMLDAALATVQQLNEHVARLEDDAIRSSAQSARRAALRRDARAAAFADGAVWMGAHTLTELDVCGKRMATLADHFFDATKRSVGPQPNSIASLSAPSLLPESAPSSTSAYRAHVYSNKTSSSSSSSSSSSARYLTLLHSLASDFISGVDDAHRVARVSVKRARDAAHSNGAGGTSDDAAVQSCDLVGAAAAEYASRGGHVHGDADDDADDDFDELLLANGIVGGGGGGGAGGGDKPRAAWHVSSAFHNTSLKEESGSASSKKPFR
jgi:hypothetical protein